MSSLKKWLVRTSTDCNCRFCSISFCTSCSGHVSFFFPSVRLCSPPLFAGADCVGVLLCKYSTSLFDWNNSEWKLLTDTQDDCCQIRSLGPILFLYTANTHFVGCQPAEVLQAVDVTVLSTCIWSVKCGLVTWTQFRVCTSTTRM